MLIVEPPVPIVAPNSNNNNNNAFAGGAGGADQALLNLAEDRRKRDIEEAYTAVKKSLSMCRFDCAWDSTSTTLTPPTELPDLLPMVANSSVFTFQFTIQAPPVPPEEVARYVRQPFA